MLAALGVTRLHLHNFSLFLTVLLALAVLTVAVFVLTARGQVEE